MSFITVTWKIWYVLYVFFCGPYRDRMVVTITTTVVSSSPAHAEVYLVQLYVINKVCQWLAAGQWFSVGTSVSSSNKTDHHDIAEILFQTGVKHHNRNTNHTFKLLNAYQSILRKHLISYVISKPSNLYLLSVVPSAMFFPILILYLISTLHAKCTCCNQIQLWILF
jgi:hypothetical protein